MPVIKCILTEQNKGSGNMVLKDEITGAKYNLIAENGALMLQEVSSTANANDIQLVDITTGRAYKLIVESSILKLEEV